MEKHNSFPLLCKEIEFNFSRPTNVSWHGNGILMHALVSLLWSYDHCLKGWGEQTPDLPPWIQVDLIPNKFNYYLWIKYRLSCYCYCYFYLVGRSMGHWTTACFHDFNLKRNDDWWFFTQPLFWRLHRYETSSEFIVLADSVENSCFADSDFNHKSTAIAEIIKE